MSFILDIMGDFIATQMQLHSKKKQMTWSLFSLRHLFLLCVVTTFFPFVGIKLKKIANYRLSISRWL